MDYCKLLGFIIMNYKNEIIGALILVAIFCSVYLVCTVMTSCTQHRQIHDPHWIGILEIKEVEAETVWDLVQVLRPELWEKMQVDSVVVVFLNNAFRGSSALALKKIPNEGIVSIKWRSGWKNREIYGFWNAAGVFLVRQEKEE